MKVIGSFISWKIALIYMYSEIIQRQSLWVSSCSPSLNNIRGCNQLTKSHTFILGVWVEGKRLFTSYFCPLPLFFAIPKWFEFIFPSFSWLEIHKSAFSAFCEIFWYAWIQKKIRKIVTPARSRDHVARKTL